MTIDVRADAFLRGMVRRIVAVLLEVGRGKMDEADGRGRPRRPDAGPQRGSRPGAGPLPPARRPRTAGADRRTERRRGTMNAKTYTVRESEIERRWFVVDAADETLGRLASRIARVLEGKHKPTYAPNLDSGDHVIVLNAVADRRHAATSARPKLYIRHSGYPAGLQGGDPRPPPRAPPRGGHPPGRQGHAAAQPARRAAAPQAEDLRRHRPSASGPAA